MDTVKQVVVVRTPRSSIRIIAHNMEFDDDKYGTVAGDTLDPPKARILLMLALTKTRDPEEVQRMFYESDVGAARVSTRTRSLTAPRSRP